MGAGKPEEADQAGASGRGQAAHTVEVEQVLAHLDALPTLPTADPQADARDLSRVIESDPSLTARVLALSRSADRNVEAASIHQVVVLLGFDAVRNLALSLTIFDLFTRNGPRESRIFDPSAFWKHCLAVACGARLLAERDSDGDAADGEPVDAESAFLCGLLHDLGKIALATCFPKAYDRALERAEQCLLNLDEVEGSIFGLDHTLAGRRLAERWRLPAMIRETVWLHHHKPEALPRTRYPNHLRIVQWADELARHLRIGYARADAVVPAA